MERKEEVKELAISFARKVIAEGDDVQADRLEEELSKIFDYEDLDTVIDWDNGTEYELNGRTEWNHGMGDLLSEMYENEYWYDDEDEDADEEGYVDRTNGLYEQVCVSIRVSIDLLVSPSMGVMGYTVGDLKKCFNGTIPEWIIEKYSPSLKEAPDDVLICL